MANAGSRTGDGAPPSRPRPSRGEIWWLDWSPGRGSEQAGVRPALVIATDAANQNPNFPNTIVAALTTRDKGVPVHIRIEPDETNGLSEVSFVMCEQIQTTDKNRLLRRSGSITPEQMELVSRGVKRTLGLT